MRHAVSDHRMLSTKAPHDVKNAISRGPSKAHGKLGKVEEGDSGVDGESRSQNTGPGTGFRLNAAVIFMSVMPIEWLL